MKIIQGDCLEVMKTMPDNLIDAVVTDPPYGIGFMGKAWDTFKPDEVAKMKDKADARAVERTDGRKAGHGVARDAGTYDRSPKGIKAYQDWCYEWAKECLRVLKPGGHLLASNSPRMYHRMAVAIEDAGFEIRDQIMWVYGSGFPKSLNIGKAVDKLQGNEREELGRVKRTGKQSGIYGEFEGSNVETKGTSEWEGWGTALKPAHEPIVLARKPLSEKTVAENVLKWGTGGLNIEISRVTSSTPDIQKQEYVPNNKNKVYGKGKGGGKWDGAPQGRFPANLIHDGSDEVVGMFPTSKSSVGKRNPNSRTKDNKLVYGDHKPQPGLVSGHSDSAARFFYTAKASKSERNRGLEGMGEKVSGTNVKGYVGDGIHDHKPRVVMSKNHHPTVKPISLMKYLIKLATPKGGTVLDPFLGSGSTAVAAKELGYECIGIEREEEYCEIARKRLANTQAPIL